MNTENKQVVVRGKGRMGMPEVGEGDKRNPLISDLQPPER